MEQNVLEQHVAQDGEVYQTHHAGWDSQRVLCQNAANHDARWQTRRLPFKFNIIHSSKKKYAIVPLAMWLNLLYDQPDGEARSEARS